MALYVPGLSAGFVWLDHREIVEGALIVDDWRDMPALFVHGRDFVGYHRPIYALMHSFDHALWGLDPRGFHLSSLVLHLLNTLGVFLLARRLGAAWDSVGARFALAALWALHPTHNPTVGLIHAKADLLVTAFMLGALVALASAMTASRSRAVIGYLTACVCFVVALFTKELAFALPIALAAGAPWRTMTAPTRRTLLRALGVCVLLCGLVALHRALTSGAAGYTSQLALSERLLTFSTVWVDSVRNLLLPFDPALADTTTIWSALPPARRAGYALACAFLVLGGASVWRYLPASRPFVALYVAFTLPAAQVIPLLHFRAERFLYLPALGVVGLAIVVVRAKVAEKRHARSVAFGSRAACVTALIWSFILGRERLATFTGDVTLFSHELRRTRDYREGASVLARALDREGRHDEATPFHERAARVNPRRISYAAEGGLVVNHAQNLLARRRFAEALAVIDARGHLAADDRAREELGYNRAIALARTNRPREALALFERYVERHPTDASAQFLLGRAAMAMGQSVRARQAWETYLHLAPHAPDEATVRQWLARLDALGVPRSPER